MISIELRELTEGDWAEILRVANEALPGATEGNAAWLANRRAFGETGRGRRQYVAAERDGAIVGYGAIEEDAGGGRFRLFVVTGAGRLAGECGDAMYARLGRDLDELGAHTAWMREQADDGPILAFAWARGFREAQRFTLDGTEMVVLELRLGG